MQSEFILVMIGPEGNCNKWQYFSQYYTHLLVSLQRKVSVVLLRLLYQSAFPELLEFTACMFGETLVSERPSRAVMCKNGFMRGLSVETLLIKFSL
jgi:hypothetical protein